MWAILRSRDRKIYEESKKTLMLDHRDDSVVSQAYNELVDNIFMKTNTSQCQIYQVVSASKGEGRTITAVNLAITLAKRDKKVLLVDTDLRSPSIYEVLDIDNGPGLVDILEGNLDIKQVSRAVQMDNLEVITSGNVNTNSFRLLSLDKLKNLLDNSRALYNFVILDSPAIDAYTDALIISPLVDGALLVIKAGETRKDDALSVKKKVESAKGNLIGVIFNKQTNFIPSFLRKLV